MKYLGVFLFLITASFGFSQDNAQERAEQVVVEHLREIFGDDYKSYGFGELYKTSPKRIMEVEKIKNNIDLLRKKNLLTDSSLRSYEQLIEKKIDTIKRNKEFSTYDLNHFFVAKEGNDEYLYKTQFFLYPDGKLKDLEQLMKYKFIGKEHDWFYGYYRRNPVLPQDAVENKKVYDYFDKLLLSTDNLESSMATVINAYSVISKVGYLDTVQLPRLLASQWIKRNKDEKATITRFSEVQVLSSEDVKLGYKLFVSYKINGTEQARYFEFDSSFVLTGNLPVNKPYEQYFVKQ